MSQLRYTDNLLSLFIAFGAVAFWSTLTLTVRLLTTLKKRSGTYFYSILITTWGLTIRQVGNFIQFYAPRCPWQIGFIMQQVGWVGMISGFSMVLYSRLTIILESHKARRAVLGMIVFNGFVWHTVMITVLSGMRTTQYAGNPAGKYLVRLAEWATLTVYLRHSRVETCPRPRRKGASCDVCHPGHHSFVSLPTSSIPIPPRPVHAVKQNTKRHVSALARPACRHHL
jgi:hypothetical protein